LRRLERALQSVFPVPHSKNVDQWAALLLPLQHVGGFTLEDYIGHLLTTTFGIVPPEEGVDAKFLFALQHPDFDLNTILDLDPSHAARVIITLQENSEARQLAERLESSSDAVEREQVARRLGDLALEGVVSSRDEAARKAREAVDTLAAVRSRLTEAETELGQKEAEVSSLSSELAGLQGQVRDIEARTRSFWGRLRELFRRSR
jgi:ethanolamine utilization microcompartment shell protein EutS